MAAEPRADAYPALPWKDRPGPQAQGSPTPRSERDTAILRGMVRRLPKNDAGSHNNLGVVFYNKGLFADAALQFEQALEMDPRMQVAERNLQIVYFGTDHFDTTLRELQQRLDTEPSDAAARGRLARMFLFGGDAGSAIREFRRLVEQNPHDAPLYRWLARAESRRGDLDTALAVLDDAARIDPHDPRVCIQAGEVLYLRGMAAEAREWLERGLALDDTMADAHHILAFVYGELGDDTRARQHASRASELNPGYTKVDRSLSIDHYSDARFEELVGERRARPVVAEGGLVHYALGLAFRQKALYDDALREFKRAAEKGEDRWLVRQAQAEMMLLKGNSGEAAVLYGELLEEEPASPKLWNELGVTLHQMGDLAEAENAYERALALDARYALAWNNLAVVRHHRGAGGADAAFRQAVDCGRAIAETWRNLGWLHHLRKEWPEAERCYRRALEADGRLAMAWTGLGMLNLEQGRVEAARNTLARAVECDPDLPEAHYHYAFALSAAGDYPAALRETSRALELNPYLTLPRFRLLIDLQFEDAGVPAPELDATERLSGGATIEAFEFDPEALDVLSVADEAPARRAVPEEPAPLGPSSPASIEGLAAARAALDDGHFTAAMDAVQRAAALGANRIDTQLLQGEILVARGAAGEAIERFDAVLVELDHLDRPETVGIDAKDVVRRALAGLSVSLLELDRAPEAVTAAERWLAVAPANARAVTALADALEASGSPSRAAALLEAELLQQPGNLELLTRLGGAYIASGEFSRAEPALRGAIAHDATLPAAHAALGRLLAAMGRPDEAVDEFRMALDAIPSLTDAALGLADLLSEQDRPDAAVEVLATFLDLDPYSFPALVRLGDLLWRNGRQVDAGVAYRRVLHFDPGHQAALEGLERLEPSETEEPWAASV